MRSEYASKAKSVRKEAKFPVGRETIQAEPAGRKRLFYITVLNVLACFAVVAIHCSNVAFWNFQPTRTWVTGNLVETLFYPAVPIFFMISGVTLMDYLKRYDDKTFLKKRFSKTVLPFLAWSLIAYVYWILTQNNGDFYRNPLRILDGILTTKYAGTYWFFLPLFAVYLSMPILTRVSDKVKVFRYAISMGLIFVITLPLILKLLGMTFDVTSSLTPPVVGGYLTYVFLGYTLSKVELTKKQRYLIYVGGILGWAVHFFGTWILSFDAGELVTTFKGYLNLPCALAAIAVFVFFKNLDYERILAESKQFSIEKMLNWFSGVTFGIYLIHYFLVSLAPGWLNFSPTSWIWRTFGAVAVFLVSAAIVRILQKVPLLRKIVP